MKRAAVALVAVLAVLAGCAPAPLTLKAACDQLAPIQREFGKVKPDAARFATYAPKVRSVVNQSDDEAQRILEPLAAAMEAGDVWRLAGVSIGVQATCKGAGSIAWK